MIKELHRKAWLFYLLQKIKKKMILNKKFLSKKLKNHYTNGDLRDRKKGHGRKKGNETERNSLINEVDNMGPPRFKNIQN